MCINFDPKWIKKKAWPPLNDGNVYIINVMSVIQQPVKYKKRRIRRRRKVITRRIRTEKKRRSWKGEKKKKRITKRKDPKTIEKRKNQKMRAHRDIIVTPKILPRGSAKLRWAGRGTEDLLFHSLCGPVERKNPWRGRPKFDIFYIYFWGSNKKQRSCDERGGGAQRPVWRVNEPEKTGARSARARTRGQNPLVYHIFI